MILFLAQNGHILFALLLAFLSVSKNLIMNFLCSSYNIVHVYLFYVVTMLFVFVVYMIAVTDLILYSLYYTLYITRSCKCA